MLKKFILILFLVLTSKLSFAQRNCSDNDLTSVGWVKHSSDKLNHIMSQLSKKISSPFWKEDMETNFFSGSLEKFVHFQSWDNLETDDLEMYGDAVFYSDTVDGKIIEIRWYENRQKNFVQRSDMSCSVDEVPLAENALF